MEQEGRIDRNAFVQAGLSSLGQGLGGLLGSWLGLAPGPEPAPAAQPVLRPPGALAEPAFLRACTRCDACAGACPHFAIKVAGRADGVAVGTPFMHDLAGSPCMLCPEMPCVAACAVGALVPIDPTAVRIGVAQIATDHCDAHQGTACQACVAACPVGSQGIVVWEGRPMVVPLGCTGCGQCLAACPAEPRAIAVLPTA